MQPATTKPKFPWLIFILLLASIYVFWILPAQMGARRVKVEFNTPTPQHPDTPR